MCVYTIIYVCVSIYIIYVYTYILLLYYTRICAGEIGLPTLYRLQSRRRVDRCYWHRAVFILRKVSNINIIYTQANATILYNDDNTNRVIGNKGKLCEFKNRDRQLFGIIFKFFTLFSPPLTSSRRRFVSRLSRNYSST